MRMRTPWAGLVLAILPPLPSAVARGDAEAVEVGLSEAGDLIASGKWKAARTRLLALLDREGASDAVVERWHRCAEGLALATFWERYQVPEPEVVVPEIVSWNASRGALKLRYERGRGGLGDRERGSGDFIRTKGEDPVYLHPMRFTGPYSIELSGRSLDETPVVFVEWLWGSLKGFGYGTSYGVVFGDQTGIVAVDAGEAEVLDDCSTSLEHGRRYAFEVRVTTTAVSASYNGKRLLTVKRPKGDYGQFGLKALDAFDQVEITGEVDPAWIRGLVQERVLADWQKFLEGYDPLGDAPAELRERIEGEVERARDYVRVTPGPADERCVKVSKSAARYYDDDEFDEGLQYVRGLGDDDVPQLAREWFEAVFLATVGDLEGAARQLAKVVQEDPDFYEGRLLQARLHQALASAAEELAEHQRLLADFPDRAEPYEDLALAHLMRGRMGDAEDVLASAVVNGVPVQALRDIGITLLRARYGPRWPERFEYASRYYVVSSNASQTLCVRVATELDETYRAYQSQLGRIQGDYDKFPVFFFAGEAGYQDYCSDLLGTPAESTLGIFHPALKQLLVWNSPDPGSTMRTVRHEGFHQYFDRLVGDSPVWLNEGMAEYYEEAGFVGTRFQEGQVNEAHVALLVETRGHWTPLRDLVHGSNRTFRAKSSLHYAQSWALVHYLSNGGKEPRKRLKTLLDALVDGAENEDAVELAFGDVDWRELESAYSDYVHGLR